MIFDKTCHAGTHRIGETELREPKSPIFVIQFDGVSFTIPEVQEILTLFVCGLE